MQTTLTLAQLQQNARALLRIKFPDKALHDESWLGKQANALAGLLWSLHQQVQRCAYNSVPNNLADFDALAQWAHSLGLPNGDGGFGPKGATAATGLVGTATGTPTSVVWNGSGDAPQLVAPDGVTLFELTAAATIGGGGSVSVSINAVTTGTGGNLASGSTLTFVGTIAGVDATATLTTGTDNGAALGTAGETDTDEGRSSLLARLLDLVQNPPKGIPAASIRQAVAALSGVSRAYVFPRRQGTGSFDVLALQGGSGSSRQITAPSLVASIEDTIAEHTSVEVEGSNLVTATFNAGHAVRVRITPVSSYPWDWDSSTGTWTVAAYNGTAKTVQFNVAAPADFQAAVTAGRKPRIAVLATGTKVQQVARVTAYNSGTTTATLEAAFTTAPTVGDAITAGAAFVEQIGTSLLSYADSLGPGRSSLSTTDAVLDVWDDTLRIDQIRRVALDAADANGARYVQSFVTSPTIDGSTSDITAADAINVGPEVLQISTIMVEP